MFHIVTDHQSSSFQPRYHRRRRYFLPYHKPALSSLPALPQAGTVVVACATISRHCRCCLRYHKPALSSLTCCLLQHASAQTHIGSSGCVIRPHHATDTSLVRSLTLGTGIRIPSSTICWCRGITYFTASSCVAFEEGLTTPASCSSSPSSTHCARR